MELINSKYCSYSEECFDRSLFYSACCILYAAINQRTKEKRVISESYGVTEKTKLENYIY